MYEPAKKENWNDIVGTCPSFFPSAFPSKPNDVWVGINGVTITFHNNTHRHLLYVLVWSSCLGSREFDNSYVFKTYSYTALWLGKYFLECCHSKDIKTILIFIHYAVVSWQFSLHVLVFWLRTVLFCGFLLCHFIVILIMACRISTGSLWKT